MVTRRKRKDTPEDDFQIEVRPISERTDEEMAAFWGPNWKEDLEESRIRSESGQNPQFGSTEEFLAYLRSLSANNADVRD